MAAGYAASLLDLPRRRHGLAVRYPVSLLALSRKGVALVVDALNARDAMDAATSERAFQQLVFDYARLLHWLCYHTFDSRRSAPGFPDIIMIREDRIVAAELKSERGRVSRSQRRWLDLLAVTGKVETFVWRPSDWDEIERVLK